MNIFNLDDEWHVLNSFKNPLLHRKSNSVVDGLLGQVYYPIDKDKDKDKDLFIGPQEFVVGYSKAPEQPQSSARPICHSHTMTRTGREPATVRIAA